MGDILSADEVLDLAKKAGLTVPSLCERASVAPSTFYRWLKGQGAYSPTLDVYRRLIEAIPKPTTGD